MVELVAKGPCAGLLPVTRGGVTLTAVEPGPITALMPFRGREAALSDALMAAHGLAFPAPGRVTEAGTLRCLWSGRAQALLIGGPPDAGLLAHAAVIDQSDGWAVVRLQGAGAEAVLARLVPLDLREGAFPEGSTARTLCQHMTVSVTRRGAGFEIMAFRSMARTLVHEIATAMALVAARSDG